MKRMKRKRRKPGPKPTTGPGTLIGVRAHKEFLAALDQWRLAQPEKPSRPQAMVRLASAGLEKQK